MGDLVGAALGTLLTLGIGGLLTLGGEYESWSYEMSGGFDAATASWNNFGGKPIGLGAGATYGDYNWIYDDNKVHHTYEDYLYGIRKDHPSRLDYLYNTKTDHEYNASHGYVGGRRRDVDNARVQGHGLIIAFDNSTNFNATQLLGCRIEFVSLNASSGNGTWRYGNATETSGSLTGFFYETERGKDDEIVVLGTQKGVNWHMNGTFAGAAPNGVEEFSALWIAMEMTITKETANEDESKAATRRSADLPVSFTA